VYSYDDVLDIKNIPESIYKTSNLQRIQNVLMKYVSDWLRLYLLYTQGGVYIDISCVGVKNFTTILDMDSDNLQGYNYPYDNFSCMENWFLASPPHNPFVKRWLDETIIAHVNPTEYAEKNVHFAPELNKALLLPYLVQHLAWTKVAHEISGGYTLLGNAIDGPFFFMHKSDPKQTNLYQLLSLRSFPPNVAFIKLNQNNRLSIISMVNDKKTIEKYNKSRLLQLLKYVSESNTRKQTVCRVKTKRCKQ